MHISDECKAVKGNNCEEGAECFTLLHIDSKLGSHVVKLGRGEVD